MRRALLLAALALLQTGSPSAAASSWPSLGPLNHDVFGFGGEVLIRIDPPTEGFEPDNRIFGIGYQALSGDPWAGQVGAEAGFAARLGGRDSVELWGGVVGRYNFTFADFRIAPALTVGLSVVSDLMQGGETRRVEEFDGDGTLLFYLAPEVSLGLVEHPELELFARVHHRSGAWGTLGRVHGAADVLALGLRYHF